MSPQQVAIPSSYFVGQEINWDAPWIEVYLWVELPFWLMTGNTYIKFKAKLAKPFKTGVTGNLD